jgi:hypothetical protein
MPDDDARLIVGADGVTYASADELLTVCYEDCVAGVTFPDDVIALFDIDGTTIELAANDWRDGEKAFTTIRAALPADVALDARRTFGVSAVPTQEEGDDEAIDFDDNFDGDFDDDDDFDEDFEPEPET